MQRYKENSEYEWYNSGWNVHACIVHHVIKWLCRMEQHVGMKTSYFNYFLCLAGWSCWHRTRDKPQCDQNTNTHSEAANWSHEYKEENKNSSLLIICTATYRVMICVCIQGGDAVKVTSAHQKGKTAAVFINLAAKTIICIINESCTVFFNSSLCYKITKNANHSVLQTEMMPANGLFCPNQQIFNVQSYKTEDFHIPEGKTGEYLTFLVDKCFKLMSRCCWFMYYWST